MNADQLGKKLAELISGSVQWDRDVVNGYSVDSSSYRILPKLVVFPKNIQDIIKTVKFAARNKIGITPRGGGTGLVGGGIGEGIIMNLMGIGGITLGRNHVTVGAGTLKGELDKALTKTRQFLSPNPSVGPYCTLGGMIATNASGTLAIKYGSIVDNILEIEFVDGCGNLQKFPGNSRMSSQILNIVEGIDREKFPKVRKNSCGYRLEKISSVNNVHKVLAGSEGTLGIIVSAKLKIHSLSTTRSLSVYGYRSRYDTVGDCQKFNQINPSSLEFVDGEILRGVMRSVPKWAKCLLMVETDDGQTDVDMPERTLKGRLITSTRDGETIKMWWRYRHSSLPNALRNLPKTGPHIFEDAAVPVGDLGSLMLLIKEMENKFGVRAILYGHIGSGNPHVILIPAIKEKTAIKDIAKWYYAGVIRIGGTITAEHGDGQARTDFIRQQYGDEIFSRFQQLKKLLDPRGILNPGKIISSKSQIVRNIVLD